MCQLSPTHTLKHLDQEKAHSQRLLHRHRHTHPITGAQMKMNYAFCHATRNKYMIHPLFPHNWAHRNTCKMGKVVAHGDTQAHTHTYTHTDTDVHTRKQK